MDESSIVIIGASGQVGKALQEIYPRARAVTSKQLDITDNAAVVDFGWKNIKVIINAAAYTDVDGAETTEGRADAWKVNAIGAGNLTFVAMENDMTIVHISSDYVFDGTKNTHDENESFSPLSVYGQAKTAGDIAVSTAEHYYIVRTSWVIGDGKNFVRTMKQLAEKGIKPNVVNDQIGRLTFANDLAKGIKHLIDTHAPYGTYNLTNEGRAVSWATIAQQVFKLTNHNPEDITGVTTAEYYKRKEGIAPRPLQSTLNLDKIESTNFTPREWEIALKDYLQTPQ
ncbi:MAG: putative dTDP-4-dehydrorhamnose 3,5-epimerase [Candidatus Saccharibacteria bacterium]|nr:putative dTDP-4-dehydrorhamnose 3,5-epimerase [Candidatus Saccharibacteria bacterium]